MSHGAFPTSRPSGPGTGPAPTGPGPGPAPGPASRGTAATGRACADPAAAALAGGAHGPAALEPLLHTVLDALGTGARDRRGPLPPGGPKVVADRLRTALHPVLPEDGGGPREALATLVKALAEGAADPADPHCAAHLHCPPLAVAAAADLAAAALNPSLDSWDQAPAATALETELTRAVAALVYPRSPLPDAVVTSGGTESNLVALLLARERARATGARTVQVVCGTNAHHSVHRAAWLLGLPTPVTVACDAGRVLPAALDRALADTAGPALVVATAGTTDEGLIDPLDQLARVATTYGAELHVDAAYGGALLFSDTLRGRLDGLDRAVTVTLDLHKLGWQPVPAGLLAVRDTTALEPLTHQTDYLNADDDTEAGLPDLLGRSLRTTRRPDAFKMAVTFRALGRTGLARLVEHCVHAAERLAALADGHPRLRRRPGPVGISTVLLRPAAADDLARTDGEDAGDAYVAGVRRRLLTDGRAVVGRARARDADGHTRLWLKATLLHPAVRPTDLEALAETLAETRP
ncbi:pyridoxal phosphate-dependent decarboxylase family protein [Streptomyces zingiberis]|uniref:Aspartate aminotransferase family protein n=1 Tax=Streptomyces zingiberis TaxID=2053010 RepID=A0ABX1BXW4_9ACTN|nr:aminotransferase class V-fold PLP-dependent enzyme [Streptomyces zingiberis]NJQ02466.1 aspartate aminotransferase family protein [Streptomyces zingiberis]